jgi:propanol-preferring alcohol dehydrogenase
MKAMLLVQAGSPLEPTEVPLPVLGPGQILVRVSACGVCRTDLHVFDGDIKEPKLPLVLGHEIVGRVAAMGAGVNGFVRGQRVGIPWLGHTCGRCSFCVTNNENLCDSARFTGYQIDGGYAEFTVADSRFCFAIPDGYSDVNAAPLLCAGLIGYRALRMAGTGPRLGLYGFGAAAHIVAQIAMRQRRQVYAFTRPGDAEAQDFARSLGAEWAGDSTQAPPVLLDAAIIFAPVGALIPLALRAVVKAGRVICAGIHMSDIPAFPYNLLWDERTIRSVANLTRQDGLEFFEEAARGHIQTSVKSFRLDEANTALEELRAGKFQGAAVLDIGSA